MRQSQRQKIAESVRKTVQAKNARARRALEVLDQLERVGVVVMEPVQ
jgi:hypothetical protein